MKTIDLKEPSLAPMYTFVIPVFNEEATLPELRARLVPVLDRLDGTSEVLLVDDGSSDRSWQIIGEIHDVDQRFNGVQFSRNFGHQVAISAGMDLARGSAVVVMDADLQDPPEVVLEMAEKWRRGYEIVYGVRDDRSTDSWFKRATAGWFYQIMNRLSDVQIPPNVGDFRLIDRRVVDAFCAMREGSRFVRGMFSWVGFRQAGVSYRRDPRYAGETKYPVRKMMRLAADATIGFSRVPLRVTVKLGAITSFFSLLGGLCAVLLKVFGYAVPGWTSILVAVCLIGGLQLAFLGIIGQYIGRTYEEALRRPLYVVSHLLGVAAPLSGVPRAVIAEPATLASLVAPDTLVGQTLS